MKATVPKSRRTDRRGNGCSGRPRATQATANICTAGLNLALLNLALLNSPWLRQGQDEVTRFQSWCSKHSPAEAASFFCSVFPQLCPATAQARPVQQDKALVCQDSTSALLSHLPCLAQVTGPHGEQRQEQALGVWTPSLLYWRCPMYIQRLQHVQMTMLTGKS